MSMVVKNNMAALSTLNTLNRNSNSLRKSLQKVSSGMKINSAADDSSGYAISERMRVQIRSLDQANDNTQNTSSLMKTAEGAVSSSVEILKTMKQKAINAATDTNTDLDRAIIQKELDQAIDQVEDNANVTFNGKWLLNGVQQVIDDPKTAIVAALHTEWLENALNLIEETYGLSFEDPQAYDTKGDYYAKGNSDRPVISLHFNGAGEEDLDPAMSNALAYVTNWAVPSRGESLALELHINMDKYKDLVMEEDNVDGAMSGSKVANLLDRTIAHEMTHAVMAANIKYFSDLPHYIKEGSADAVPGSDHKLSNITTYLSSASDLDYYTTAPVPGAGATDKDYEMGFVYFRYLANNCPGEPTDPTKRFMRALNEGTASGLAAVDGAVSLASLGKFKNNAELVAQMKADYTNAGSTSNFLARYCGINTSNDDTGALTGYDAGYKVTKTAHSVLPEGGSTRFWYLPTTESSFINGLEIEWGSNFTRPDKAFTFQVGTKANQAIKAGFEDLSARGLGLMAADGTKASVATQFDAKRSITLFDQAVRKALDMQTTIGSLQSRLEYTSANLITSSENTQGAESVIRDADMAKEMTEYTKNNVLMQSAQSMLAQANQNSSSVLSLLQ